MAKVKATAPAPSNPTHNPATGAITVTITDKDSWIKAAGAFIKAKGNQGFVIRHADGKQGSFETKQAHTLAQWLAWMNYLDRHHVSHSFLDSFGMATMPAEWPWLFDISEVEGVEYWHDMASAWFDKRDAERAQQPLPDTRPRAMMVRDAMRGIKRPEPPAGERRHSTAIPNYADEPLPISGDLGNQLRGNAPIGEGRTR